ANPTNEFATGVLIVYDGDGTIVGTKLIQLPGNGHSLLSISDSFKLRTQLRGHAEFVSDHAVVGSLSFANSSALASIAADAELPPDVDGKWTSVFPFVEIGPNRWVGISIINQSTGPGLFTLRLNSASGQQLANRSIPLDRKAQIVINVSDLVPGWQGQGY